jgi:CBS domain-containing protein
MAASLDRLRSLRVADAMNHRIVPVSADQTMAEAASLFIKHGISGAPVVDAEGRCIGMLSSTDFVSRDRDPGDATSPTAREKTIIRRAPGGPWEVQDVYPDRVSAHMTTTVQSVSADSSLVEAGRIMCSQHIHRLPVLDAQGHPHGMLTSMDIVAALVQAVDENERPQGRA